MDPDDRSGIRARGEEAVGELAQALIENPIFNGALSTRWAPARGRCRRSGTAMGALNLASGSDVERLEQRLRSLSGGSRRSRTGSTTSSTIGVAELRRARSESAAELALGDGRLDLSARAASSARAR